MSTRPDPEPPDATPDATPDEQVPTLDAARAPKPRRRAVDRAPLIPGRSADDSDVGWGGADDSNDQRLREDVPPHW